MDHPVELCPVCGEEGDPIQAINCKPVKWSCLECRAKWNEDGLIKEEKEAGPTYL